jgi:hypothetical protein
LEAIDCFRRPTGIYRTGGRTVVLSIINKTIA